MRPEPSFSGMPTLSGLSGSTLQNVETSNIYSLDVWMTRFLKKNLGVGYYYRLSQNKSTKKLRNKLENLSSLIAGYIGHLCYLKLNSIILLFRHCFQ